MESVASFARSRAPKNIVADERRSLFSSSGVPFPLRVVCLLQDEAAEGHVVGLDLATGEPLDPVTCVLVFPSPPLSAYDSGPFPVMGACRS